MEFVHYPATLHTVPDAGYNYRCCDVAWSVIYTLHFPFSAVISPPLTIMQYVMYCWLCR